MNNNDIDNDNDTCLYPTTVYPAIPHLFAVLPHAFPVRAVRLEGERHPVSGNLPDGKIMGPRENLGILLTK